MEKNLLPEQEYLAWDKNMVALREKTQQLTLRFNTTGGKASCAKSFSGRWTM